MDYETKRMDLWEKIVPRFVYNPELPFFDMVVPTTDTVRFGYLLEKFLAVGHSVLYTGFTGVGKVGFVIWTPRLRFPDVFAIACHMLQVVRFA